MPLWRCPHCGTPQPETARCWVCRRSTTSCATCRHFRRGVTAGLGFCGLDRRRLALRGDEMRACWSARPDMAADDTDARAPAAGPGVPTRAALPGGGGGVAGRTFVPVEELRPARARAPEGPSPTTPTMRAGPAGRWSLWGDLEP